MARYAPRLRLAGWLPRPGGWSAATRLQLAPRRLEARRMLDAAAPALALELAGATCDYAQVGADPSQMAAMASDEAAAATTPTGVQVQATSPIDEGGVAALKVTLSAADPLAAHTAEINWGDGTVEAFNVPQGSLTFIASHHYLDDSPAGTDADDYLVSVRVVDDAGGAAGGSATIRVNNVAPVLRQIESLDIVTENGEAELKLTFDDPGALDAHTVEIDWGDGSAAEVFNLTVGGRSFATSHQYLDDDPGGTAADDYLVNVRVLDDDGGAASGSASIHVKNVAPALLQVESVDVIAENGEAELKLTFNDPGALDAHRVEIDWGDGSAAEVFNLTVGARSLAAAHQYLDDDPTGTTADDYLVTITLADDDQGETTAALKVTVNNAAPANVIVDPLAAIDENGLATLKLAFDDPGSKDVHTAEIDWGDGSMIETVSLAAGSRQLVAAHRYLDDNPPGTPSDSYAINVRIWDDDGGAATASLSVTVNNVAPFDVHVTAATGAVNEGDLVALGFEFTDFGSQDVHVWEVDWGDGFVSSGPAAGRSFAAAHTFADNGEYTVQVRVADDDGGVGTASAKVIVKNVAPTLAVAPNQTISEGSLLAIGAVGAFSDPGFDNPFNTTDPDNGGETTERFSYTIDWGDGSPLDLGAANIDAAGSIGAPTSGSFGGNHTYADNGIYRVTVTVFDDDGGASEGVFQVTVVNVDPTLAGVVTPLAIHEGQAFTLASLGIRIQDPGFDNLALGTSETFIDAWIDWGDGSPAAPFTTANRHSGGPGVPTTAEFVHDAHVYADDGKYTVTVMLSDDDGAVVARTFAVHVFNVAPTLTLTADSIVIDEGSMLAINNLGSFTDPGFDNLLNPSGASAETFSYTIDWGDGTVEAGQLPATRVSGGPGAATSGTLADAHFYADNDPDNHYTITVTLTDDDGGVDVQSFEITVFNVNPTLRPIAATDVATSGMTTLTLSFSDPGADSFQVLVDWGDRLNLPPGDRFVVATAYAGPTPQGFVLTHVYQGPPDPLHPSADIVISVMVRDDDFGAPLVVAPGQSNVETVAISNPGIGKEAIRIDTTPNAPRLALPDRPAAPAATPASQPPIKATASDDVGGSAGDSRATSERFLELRVINPDGSLSQGYRLQPEALNNLPALFRNLPDNHYAIYVVQSETNVRRLVIEAYVRNGKLIDPGDDSEGARDRPPTDDKPRAPVEVEPGDLPPPAESDAGATGQSALPAEETTAASPRRLASSAAIFHRATLGGVALALSSAGRDWHQQLEQKRASDKRPSDRRLGAAADRHSGKQR
ncbi:MAG: hypothetical protein IT424_12985 [Pirellulales bacterium]|nr:hypothetical protein [Pirellulales bacterium]